MSFHSEHFPANAESRLSCKNPRFQRRLIDTMLPAIDAGRLQLMLPNGEIIVREGVSPGPDATMNVHRWRALWRMFSAGENGFSDAYIAGEWSTPDLTALLMFFDCNAGAVERVSRSSALGHLRDRLFHRRNDNTLRGSRRNISAHYDLGNSFYRLWLDDGMNYSSALYSG